jgi:hypothetical protein
MKRKMNTKFGSSMSEIISSLVFLSMGLLFSIEALIQVNLSDYFRATIFSSLAFLCFCAVLRFVIASAYEKNRKK